MKHIKFQGHPNHHHQTFFFRTIISLIHFVTLIVGAVVFSFSLTCSNKSISYCSDTFPVIAPLEAF